jgi:hypothetical protein
MGFRGVEERDAALVGRPDQRDRLLALHRRSADEHDELVRHRRTRTEL